MLTAKRRWNFKLPPLTLDEAQSHNEAAKQPLLMSPRMCRQQNCGGPAGAQLNDSSGEETIYWPKLAPSSPKLKVTFNDTLTSTLSDNNLTDESDGKR